MIRVIRATHLSSLVDLVVKKLYNNFVVNISVSILSPSDEPAWQAYVNFHPDATIYHTLEWRDILYNEYMFEPVYLIAKSFPSPSTGEGRGEGERVVGVLPMFLVKNLKGRRMVSLPFSIYGGPVGDSYEIVSALLSKAKDIATDGVANYIEVKCRPYPPDVPSPLAGEGQGKGVPQKEFLCEEKGITVDLTVGINELWKGFTDRNDINRAVREGLKFKLSEGEGIEKFYRLQLMTRKRHGLPTPSLRYYRSFFEKMPGMVKLALVEKGGPIAGGIFFAYRGSILYALGASEQKYLYCRPNDLLIWKMMKWGCENEYQTFDLGPTPIYDKGLLHFKRKWGGNTSVVSRYFFPSRSPKVGLEGSTFFKVMPTVIARVIGSKAIRLLA